MYCLGCLVWTRRAPIPAILFQMKHPKNVFGRWRVPVKFTGKSGVIFSGPKFSCAFEKHPKVVSGALRDGFRARDVFGSFEKRTPGHCEFLLYGSVSQGLGTTKCTNLIG